MANSSMRVSTDALAERDRLDSWRQLLSDIYELGVPDDGGAPFKAFFELRQAGDMFVSESCASPLEYRRSKALIARSGVDSYLIHMCLTGGFVGDVGNREVRVRPGDLVLLDLGRESRYLSDEALCFTVAVAREALEVRHKDPHGVVLSSCSGLGAVLAAHFRSMRQQVAHIDASALAGLATGTAALVDACFAPSAAALERAAAQVDGATLVRIKRFIAENLHAPDLGPDLIAARFRLSRSRLYALFEATGGIQRYIQAERLKRCYDALINPAHQRRRIFEIAFDWGFTNEAHFSRLFRRTFGATPSDVRRLGQEIDLRYARAIGGPTPIQLNRWAARIQAPVRE